MPEPLINRLKRSEFVTLAELQDRFIEMLYSFDNEFVMHGGTAIWRCYSGNRFSYDIDGYIVSAREEKLLNEELTWKIAGAGMELKSIRYISGSIFATVADQEAELKLEFIRTRKQISSISVPYEKLWGDYLTVRTLSPENFILEKIRAYEGRRYTRDLYDIYQLVGRIGKSQKLTKKLRTFMDEIEPPLSDKGGIEGVVLTGITPSFDDIVRNIRGSIGGR